MKSTNQPLWIPHEYGKPGNPWLKNQKVKPARFQIPFGGKQLISYPQLTWDNIISIGWKIDVQCREFAANQCIPYDKNQWHYGNSHRKNMRPELQISMWIHVNTNSLKASYYILYNSPESSLPQRGWFPPFPPSSKWWPPLDAEVNPGSIWLGFPDSYWKWPIVK